MKSTAKNNNEKPSRCILCGTRPRPPIDGDTWCMNDDCSMYDVQMTVDKWNKKNGDKKSLRHKKYRIP